MLWNSIGFELLELLGEGSQGSVYKALRSDRSSGLRQTVAVKILHSKTAVSLWRQEFESLSQVRSNYCVRVLSFERFKRRPALILEFVEGASLAQLGQLCALDESEIYEISAQLQLALRDLHDHKVFHGDLSPQNILVDITGRVRVLDFGLANSSLDHSRVTPRFASPERLAGGPSSIAADLYSLGKVAEYLRGYEGAESPYLYADPERRSFQDLSLCPGRQSLLAGRVKSFLARRKISNELKTQTQTIERQKTGSVKAFVLGTITSLMILATSSASQAIHPQQLGLLTMRTKKWHYFLLNGRPIGYSPISLPIEARKAYRLQWISAENRGEKVIRLETLEKRTLEDSDFSH